MLLKITAPFIWIILFSIQIKYQLIRLHKTTAVHHNYLSGTFADYTNSIKFQKVAWYGGFGDGYIKTCKVGTKLPNQLGIYNMSGNVWEFCRDWWSEGYPITEQTDYRCPASTTRAAIVLYRTGVHGVWKTLTTDWEYVLQEKSNDIRQHVAGILMFL